MDCKQLKQDFEEILKAKEELVGILGMKKLEINDIAIGQKLKLELKAKIKELENKLAVFVITGPDGVEIRINMNEEIKKWQDFYKKYNIDSSSLDNLRLSEKGIKDLKETAEEYGFDKIVMIPKGVSAESLVNNDKFAIFIGSEEEKQNTGTNGKIEDWSNQIIGSDHWKEKTDKPQIILLKNKKNVDSEEDETMKKIGGGKTTRNCKYPEIMKMEKKLDMKGLDIVTAMIMDRQNFDQTDPKHHLWDWNDKNAVWLTKTAGKIVKGRCARLYWDPDSCRWRLLLYSESSCDDVLGSVFTRSLETKQKS